MIYNTVEGKTPEPLLSVERFDASAISQAHALVASGSLGKVVVEFETQH